MIANKFYARSVETSLFDIIISHDIQKKKREEKQNFVIQFFRDKNYLKENRNYEIQFD